MTRPPALPDHPKLIHVVGAAIVRDGLCLAAQRSAEMSTPLKWEFPGGKVEAGESPEAALARELREEMGVEIEVGAFLGRGQVEAGERLVVLDVYLARLTAGHIALSEHEAFGWFGPEAIPDLDWAKADIPCLAPLLRALESDRIDHIGPEARSQPPGTRAGDK